MQIFQRRYYNWHTYIDFIFIAVDCFSTFVVWAKMGAMVTAIYSWKLMVHDLLRCALWAMCMCVQFDKVKLKSSPHFFRDREPMVWLFDPMNCENNRFKRYYCFRLTRPFNLRFVFFMRFSCMCSNSFAFDWCCFVACVIHSMCAS